MSDYLTLAITHKVIPRGESEREYLARLFVPNQNFIDRHTRLLPLDLPRPRLETG